MKTYLIILATTSLLVSGCATKGNFQQAFDDKETINNSNQVIAATPEVIFDAALEVTSKQGFNVDTVDPKGRVLTVSKEIKNDEDKELSHTIKSTITVVPGGDESLVMLSANQVTEMHKKSYVWWHLLWVLPLIPIDTEYTTVVTDRDTIRETEFYTSFFSKLNQSVTVKNKKIALGREKADKEVALIKAQEEEIQAAIKAKEAGLELEHAIAEQQQQQAAFEAEQEAKAAKKAKRRSRKS